MHSVGLCRVLYRVCIAITRVEVCGSGVAWGWGIDILPQHDIAFAYGQMTFDHADIRCH